MVINVGQIPKFEWIVAVFLLVPGALAQPSPHSLDQWSAVTAQGLAAYTRGDYPESEKLYTQALALAENFGETDDRLAASLSNLGTAYRAQGTYAEAAKLYRRALGLREAMFGPEHPQ